MTTRILVADGQRLFADALRHALGDAGLEVIGAVPTTGVEAARAIIDEEPDVALVDYWLPVIAGPGVAAVAARHVPACRTVLLSGWLCGDHEKECAVHAGATALVPKTAALADVVHTIVASTEYAVATDLAASHRGASTGEVASAANGDRSASRSPVGHGASCPVGVAWQRLAKLTRREIEVAAYVHYVPDLDEVAHALGIRRETVRTHLRNMYAKLDAASQTDLLAMLRRYGVLSEAVPPWKGFDPRPVVASAGTGDSSTGPWRVIVADRQPLFAEVVAAALDRYEHIDVALVRAHDADALRGAVVDDPVDVVVLDEWIAGPATPATVAWLASTVPEAAVLLVSGIHNADHIAASLAAGAAGRLDKNVSVADLAAGVRSVATGERMRPQNLRRLLERIDARESAWIDASARIQSLTPREREVLAALSGGAAVAEVARELGVAVSTVEQHIHKILAKTRTNSYAEAVALARRTGNLEMGWFHRGRPELR